MFLNVSAESARYHAPQDNDHPDSWRKTHDDSDESTTSTSQDDEDWSDVDEDDLNEDEIDLYEAYLRDQQFPAKYDNEHKKFLVAKAWMKKDQQRKVTKVSHQLGKLNCGQEGFLGNMQHSWFFLQC